MKLTRYALALSAFLIALAAVAPAQENVWVSHGPTGAARINAIAIDPQRPSTIWAGGVGDPPSSGPGLFRSTDNGSSWSRAGGPQGPPSVKALLIDPEDPRTMYAGWDSVFRTNDGGETWTESLIPGSVGPLTSLAIDPTDTRRVWASTYGHIQRSGAAWVETGSGLFLSDGAERWVRRISQSIYSVLFDKRRPGTMYAGSYDEIKMIFGEPFRTGGSLFVSHDYGNTFTKSAFEFIKFEGGIRSIVADPFHHDAVYICDGRRVYRGNDRGVTSQTGDVYMEFGQIVADPVRPGRLYGTQYIGFTALRVVRSEDGARTWHPFSEGLPTLPLLDPLVISPDGRWLYVGTNAAGVFARDLEISDEVLDVSSGAAGRSRILFWDSDSLSVQTLAESGSWTSTPFEGPYSGWNAIAIADGSDGLSRVLWQNVDGRVGLELVGPAGKVDAFRFDAEPGWKAIDISLGSDGRTHLLRTSADGKMRITSVDSSGSAVEGQLYGPYDGWSAHAIDDGPDGATWVLWQRVNGHAGIARYRADTVETAFRWDANPGGWAEDIAVGADGVARVLWTHPDGMEITSVDGQGHLFDRKVHSSAGLRARRIAGSPDGLTRVLWTAAGGSSSLWILNPDNALKSQDPIPAP